MKIEPMSETDFAELAEWRYDPPYDFYDSDPEEVKNPDRYFAVRADDGALIGFFYFERKEEGLEYGLGLRPGSTGSGLGSVNRRAAASSAENVRGARYAARLSGRPPS